MRIITYYYHKLISQDSVPAIKLCSIVKRPGTGHCFTPASGIFL
ncbi:MAG: hypothetical protein WAO21_05840 [Verrucomicrobiia bacterium]|jgi:hypothetical protein